MSNPRARARRLALLLTLGLAAGARAQSPAATGEGLLARERIAALPSPQREAWTAYLDRSERAAAADRAVIDAELRATGLARPILSPLHSSIHFGGDATTAWLASDEARRVAATVISYQTPAGGWTKRIDFTRGPRQPGQTFGAEGEWSWVGTFDNDATVAQIRFLGRVHAARPDASVRDAYRRGVEYVLHSQFPTGCWPQVYPLVGGYHDAATLNDDAMLRVIQLLRDVAGDRSGLVPPDLAAKAGAGAGRGVGCLLDLQYLADGERTLWAAQHDPLTREPAKARAYEHPSLSAHESASVLLFLMSLPSPDSRVVEAVHAGAAWLRAHLLTGLEYRGRALIRRADAPPLWPRFYELGSWRPIFSNRDSVVRYRWEELEDERRNGYAWFTYRPAAALERYASWSREHPGAAR